MEVKAKANILLFDLNPGSGLSGILRQILADSKSPELHLSVHHTEPARPPDLVSLLTALSSAGKADLVFITLPRRSNLVSRALKWAKNEGVSLPPLIALLQDERPDHVMDLLKTDIMDFITPPIKAIDVLPRIWRLLDNGRKQDRLISSLKEKIGLQRIIGTSAVFLSEIEKIPSIAKSNATVLISGETGTGKELFARAIHYLGLRSGNPFVPVNCGAMPVDLIENELFGHRKGAYTGAHHSQQGLIGQADGGTIFLDEVDCMPPAAQVKLLRFLQEKEYRQLGSLETIRSDVRVIAATNCRLDLAAQEGSFRRDLYYRLNIIPLVLPPLRQRKEDIPLLARHFLEKHALENGLELNELKAGALKKLMLHDWPGNVRELENVIERTVVLSRRKSITAADIALPEPRETGGPGSFREAKAKVVEQFEREYIHSVLLAHGGNISKASVSAGKNRRAFWELIRKHGIDAREFRPH
jgi:DNA-binding NtrC family response regulator